MIDIELEQKVREAFAKAFEEDKRIESAFKKIRTSKATYEDAQTFAKAVGDILGGVLGQIENIDEKSAYVIEQMLNQNTKLVDVVCQIAQDNLNEAAGVGMNAVKPREAYKNERVTKATETIVLAGDEKRASVAKISAQTLAQGIVDDWVQTNADFQAEAGLKPIIVRKWSGRWGTHDTKHTDWCKSLEGVYEYGKEPKNVYVRHEGCQCTVSYYPNKLSQGRITALAKGELDNEQVLWNSGSDSRQAVLRRRRKELGPEEARRILNEEWKGGLNGNAERHF